MSKKYVTRWFRASLDTYKEETGVFFKEKKDVYSQRAVNYDEYATLLANIYNELDGEGYDIVNVVPIDMGHSEECTQSNRNYVGDVGFSFVRGAVVVGKRRD